MLIISMSSCSLFSVGKKGVFYSEMSNKPEIKTYDNGFTVYTQNSIQNSALLIYKINSKIDSIHKVIMISAYQAAGKKYRDKFEVKMYGFSKAQLDSYEYFWIDPDNERNRLNINK